MINKSNLKGLVYATGITALTYLSGCTYFDKPENKRIRIDEKLVVEYSKDTEQKIIKFVDLDKNTEISFIDLKPFGDTDSFHATGDGEYLRNHSPQLYPIFALGDELMKRAEEY